MTQSDSNKRALTDLAAQLSNFLQNAAERSRQYQQADNYKELGVEWNEASSKIQLPGIPEAMPVRQAIQTLIDLEAVESQRFSIQEFLPGMPYDAAHAFVQVLKGRYGWVNAVTKQTMFGPEPPQMVTVRTGVASEDFVEVPVGKFKLQDITAELETGFARDPKNKSGSFLSFYVSAEVRHEDRKVIQEIINLTRDYLKSHSIYQGKAMRLPVDSRGQVESDVAPTFIDLSKVSEAGLVLTKVNYDLLNHTVWTPIRKTAIARKHNVPLKRGALLWGEYGCITGDAMITINRAGKSSEITLEQLVYKFNGGKSRHPTKNREYAWDDTIPTYCQRENYEDGTVRLGQIAKAWFSGDKQVYRVTTENGQSIKATDEHPFLTERGWLRLDQLEVGELVHVRGPQGGKGRADKRVDSARSVGEFYPYRAIDIKGGRHVFVHRLAYDANQNGISVDELVEATFDAKKAAALTFSAPDMVVHHIDGNPANNEPSNLQVMTQSDHARLHADENGKNVLYKIATEKVVSIEKLGIEPTYDIEMIGEPRNFIANGFVVHNTGKTLSALVTAKIAEENGWTFIMLDDPKGLVQALEMAKLYQPAVVFAEDIDRVVVRDRDDNANDILNTIDGALQKNSEVITVLTTNHIDKINQGMLRPGRLDALIHVTKPDAVAAERLVRLYAGDLLAPNVPLGAVGKLIEGEGYIPAIIAEVVNRAKLGMIFREEQQIVEDDLLTAAELMRDHSKRLEEDKKQPSPEEAVGIALKRLLGDIESSYDGDLGKDLSNIDDYASSASSYARATHDIAEKELPKIRKLLEAHGNGNGSGHGSVDLTDLKVKLEKIGRAVGVAN